MRKKLEIKPLKQTADEWVGVKTVDKTTVEFYAGMHKKFKMACGENDESMKDVMHRLINTYLREYGKE